MLTFKGKEIKDSTNSLKKNLSIEQIALKSSREQINKKNIVNISALANKRRLIYQKSRNQVFIRDN